jgi:flagella synthesis protein FlgN
MTAPAQPAQSRQEAMQQLLHGVAMDLGAYAELQELMEQQFIAAVRHQGALLEQLAGGIAALVETMEERRRQRVACAELLVGAAPSMAQVFSLLKAAPRARLEQDWQQLEQQVLECKRLGKRNSDLLVDQYTIMQRVLHGEDQIYEPA